MTVRLIEQEQEWESLVGQYAEANFLQSWAWGEFQESLGKQVFRVAAFDDNQVILGLAEGILEPAKRGAYLAIYGGPLLDWTNKPVLDAIIGTLKELGKQNNCLFIRFRPQQLESSELRNTVESLGAKPSPMHLTADLTLQLDLTLSDEELMAAMRKNHRSSIRKADKLGITTTVSSDPQEMEEFYAHQLELATRHKFVPFSKVFFTKQFEAFLKRGEVSFIHSRTAEGELLASAFVIFYNSEAVYHYGVSTDANRSLPGSYAGQWRAIQEAKARGCTRYNFWGIAPEDQPNHRFAGVSLFKRGFGGMEINYLPSHDIPLSNKYYLTWFFEKLRKKMRKL